MLRSKALHHTVMLFSASVVLGATIWQTAEERAGQSAEQAGKLREAVTHYVAALQSTTDGSEEDQRLREKIIKLVLNLDPPPGIPDEVDTYLGRGKAAIRVAQNQNDFNQAAAEFQQGLRLAPWWADGYYNLSIVQEKAGNYKSAKRNLKLYLLAAPNATDVKDMRVKLGELDYLAEQKAKNDAVAQRQALEQAGRERQHQAEANLIPQLAGTWTDSSGSTQYAVSISGNNIEILETYSWTGSYWGRVSNGGIYRGQVSGLTIQGTYTSRAIMNPGSTPLQGTISSDGRRIQLEYEYIGTKSVVLVRR